MRYSVRLYKKRLFFGIVILFPDACDVEENKPFYHSAQVLWFALKLNPKQEIRKNSFDYLVRDVPDMDLIHET